MALEPGLARLSRESMCLGTVCCLWEACRCAEDWTLLTPWQELFECPPQLENVRLFADYEVLPTEGVPVREEILVLKQDSLLLCTFRARDLEFGNVSFVKKRCGEDLRTCMLFDVRPMLAASLGQGFSYLVMFDCESEASAVLERLRRSWCAPASAASSATASPARTLFELSYAEWELEHLDSSGDEGDVVLLSA
jgi:hypothetical protein